MDTEHRIDENLERVLKAAGSSLRHYTLPANRKALRDAMREIMSASYIAGSNACHKILTAAPTGERNANWD